MSEDLVKSTTSQRSNPRVLRRVRPVPYECCGGVCSFLNSGCFTLCCNGNKTRRRSSVYAPRSLEKEENDGGKVEDRQEELSETTKRLIKPKSQDFLTEEDLYAFDRAYDCEDSDDSLRKQHFVHEFDIELDETPRKNEAEAVEIVEETNIDKEDEVSVLTDDTSISGGDGSAKKTKKKNKIMKILKMGKSKKKNKDGISVTSSASSLACSEISEDHADVKELEIESTILEKSEATQSLEKKDEVSHDETDHSTNPGPNEKGGTLGRRLQSIFSSMRPKKGSGNSSKAEGTTEESSQPELEINLKKKPFWKPFSKKDKNKRTKEIINGIKPDSIQTTTGTATAEPDDKIEVGTDAANVDSVNKMKEELPSPESKKKTLFGTLKLTKKEGEQNAQQIPCLFSACVNSNIKPEAGRKLSSDSIEVKTIAEDDLEGDGQTIKIVRNDFFPAEVHTNDDNLLGNEDVVDELDNVEQDCPDEKGEKEKDDNFFDNEDVVDGVDNTEQDYPGEMREEENKGLEDVVPEETGENKNDQIVTEDESKPEELQSIPALEKKYYIFEKEDFSESLHTLVDDEDPDHILLGPSSVLLDTPLADDGTTKKVPEDVEKEATILDAETFRTSCSLSIEASEEFARKLKEEVADLVQEDETRIVPNEKEAESIVVESEIVEEIIITEVITENITASSDTLTESKINVSIIEKSTETVKAIDKESATSSWIDVANVDDLSESKFNYIYKTTLRTVNSGGASLKEDPSEDNADIECSNGHCDVQNENKENETDNCEICGKSLQEEEATNEKEKAKCVCTTLTKPRQSLTEIEEGSVKSKVEAFNLSKNPIMFPLANVEILKKDDVTISEAHSSPTLGSKSKSATPSPIASKSRSGTLSSTNSEWQHAEEDIDRMIQGRGSLSGLGLRSDSMASVYSGAGEGRYGTVAVRGQVEFGLQYNYKAGALEIHVKQCKDLAPVDTKRNRSDPYVKVYLLPDKSKSGKRKTKVKKHTLNPVFDETLKFHISLNGLETRTLWLTVWHSDMFGRNDFLGEVMMTLENKVFDDPAPVWYNLQERTEPFDDTISFKGDIIVCLKFVPPDMTVQKKGKRSRGTLHVLVKEAKYLTAYKANGTSDPFCKSYLLPDKGRNSKQKTAVVKKTVNPVWNHTFIYEDVTLQELAERCLELTVWDHDRLASNEFLGGVRFSLGTGKHYGKSVEWMDATGKEMTLWKSMLERPNFWVEGCLSLRPSLDARTT